MRPRLSAFMMLSAMGLADAFADTPYNEFKPRVVTDSDRQQLQAAAERRARRAAKRRVDYLTGQGGR